MNNQIKYLLRKITLEYYSLRYSPYFPVITPVLFILVAMLIFWQLIVPQFYSWFSIQNEIDATNRKINVIRQNIAYLETLDKYPVDKDYLIAVSALPSDLDYIGILNSITDASYASNVTLNDYEFTLGQISKIDKNIQAALSPTEIFIGLAVEGNMENVSRFLLEVEHNLPMTEVKNLNYTDGKGEILLTFYLLQQPDIQYTYSDPITPLNQDEHRVMQLLHQWSGQ